MVLPRQLPGSGRPGRGGSRLVGCLVAALAFAAAVVDATGAAEAALGRVGAGSPRGSAWRRRVLITPLRDAIWRRSEAMTACSAVGGGGGGRLGG